ncbi:MAG: helix-turn-helix transcriptional regulator [Actinomycetaceae bacterium]|nr:helix-turn-helix transcriptional regulator [Arcanobacterium sp.]MDD7505584.1 helix-turn-helix transcriptional regulator [Actinomycetaceae bacterium]MDY6143797.1 helix-turn-helix transcriptional regulator [Arcanobacterium sp.]
MQGIALGVSVWYNKLVDNHRFEHRIADELKQIADNKGISGNQLALISGISQAQISRIFTYERTISLMQTMKLAEALGCQGSEIISTAEQGSEEGYASATYDPANECELAAAGENEQDADEEIEMMTQEP